MCVRVPWLCLGCGLILDATGGEMIITRCIPAQNVQAPTPSLDKLYIIGDGHSRLLYVNLNSWLLDLELTYVCVCVCVYMCMTDKKLLMLMCGCRAAEEIHTRQIVPDQSFHHSLVRDNMPLASTHTDKVKSYL